MLVEIAKNIGQIKALCLKHRVKALSFIDSASMDKSQINFLIHFDDNIPTMDYADNYCQLEDGLHDLFGKVVNLAFEKSFPDPEQLEAVKKSKRLLFEA